MQLSTLAHHKSNIFFPNFQTFSQLFFNKLQKKDTAFHNAMPFANKLHNNISATLYQNLYKYDMFLQVF